MSTEHIVLAFAERIKRIGLDAEKGKNLHVCCNEIDNILAEASYALSESGRDHALEALNNLFRKLLWDSQIGNTPYRHVIIYSIEHIKLKIDESSQQPSM